MKKLLPLLILLATVSCQKEPTDKLGCVLKYHTGEQVGFSEPQKQSAPGFNPIHIYTMPLIIYYTDNDHCKWGYYEATDVKGDTVKTYSSSIRRYTK